MLLITLPMDRERPGTTPVPLPSLLYRPSWDLAGVVCVISIGLMLLVAGEVDFHLVGFLLVMTASALAGLRWTITQVLLQGSNATGHGELGGE